MSKKQEKNENNTISLNDLLSKLKSFDNLNNNWDNIFKFCINYFTQYNYSLSIINVVKKMHSNKILFILIFLIISWFWSNILLQIVYYFMLIDSIIISLLILQNNSINSNSRRLGKNIILIAMTTFNLIGGILSMFLLSFIYMEYSKFINRIIFKFIKFFLKLLGNIFPPVYILYPDIKLFNFDDPDMTIVDNKNKQDYNKYSCYNLLNSDSSDDNEKKINYKNIYNSKLNTSFPSISTIKHKKIKKNKKNKKY